MRTENQVDIDIKKPVIEEALNLAGIRTNSFVFDPDAASNLYGKILPDINLTIEEKRMLLL